MKKMKETTVNVIGLGLAGCEAVYQLAKKLGRLPTVEEIESRKGKRGRPKKYKWEEDDGGKG